MIDFEEVTVKLQSGLNVRVHAWQASNDAIPLVIVAPDSSPSDWDEFISFLAPSNSPLLVNVASAQELLMLIQEIGEPVQLLSQGSVATDIVSKTAAAALGAVTSMIICDGIISPEVIEDLQSISTLLLVGRQSELLSHEEAVLMHDALSNSTLIESENTRCFPAKNNADAAAAAINWFNSSTSSDETEFGDSEPIDPKA